MVGFRLYADSGGWDLWVGPADDLAQDNIANSFVLGSGDTPEEAIADGLQDLQQGLALLLQAHTQQNLTPAGEQVITTIGRL